MSEPRQQRAETRRQLLDAALGYVAEHGIAELSLRDMGRALGTSHRMLIYYFGSKQELLAEVIKLARMAWPAVEDVPDLPAREYGWWLWNETVVPRWRREVLVVLDAYTFAMGRRSVDLGEQWSRGLGYVQDRFSLLGVRYGMPPETLELWGRVALAAMRGLFMERSPELAERAWGRLLDVYEEWLAVFRRTGAWPSGEWVGERNAPAPEPPSERLPAGPGWTRERLLDLLVDHVVDSGLVGTSLRNLAEEIGTSHRVLLYHFGSKSELMRAVLAAVNLRIRRELIVALALPDLPVIPLSRKVWVRLTAPDMLRYVPVMHEIEVEIMRGRFSPESFDRSFFDQMESMTAVCVEAGMPPRMARDQVEIGVAVGVGLRMSLLLGDDQAKANQAMDLILVGHETWRERVGSNPLTPVTSPV